MMKSETKTTKMQRHIIIIVLVSAVFLFMLNLVSTQENESNYSEKVSSDILNELNKSSEVSVYIIMNLKNDTIMDFILSNLSPSEFKFQEKLLRGDAFAGNITKGGLDKLVNNPNVKMIYFNRVVHTLDNGTKDESLNETKIEIKEVEYQKINWWLIFPILIILLVIIYLIFRKKK